MRAIVNYSTEKYYKGQDRLFKSIPVFSGACVMLKERSLKTPSHSENPYAFKIYAFEYAHALNFGYQQIVWLDASMYAVKPLEPLFEHIEREGYFLQDSEWPNSRWTNKRALEYFGTNEGQNISSGCVGLDFTKPIGREFFKLWKQSMLDGIFKGSWEDHRHDQTCASLIALKLGMTISPKDTFFQYATEPPIKEHILLIVDGIC